MHVPINAAKKWAHKFEKVWQSDLISGQGQGFINVVRDAATDGATMTELEPQFVIAGERFLEQIVKWREAAIALCSNVPYYVVIRDPTTGVRSVFPAEQLELKIREQFSRILTNSVLGPQAKAMSYVSTQVTLGLCATCRHLLCFSPCLQSAGDVPKFWKGLWFSTKDPEVLKRANAYTTIINASLPLGAVLGVCGLHKPSCSLRCHSCATIVNLNVDAVELSGWRTTGCCLKCGLTGLLAVSPPAILTGRLSDDKATTRRYHEKFKRLRK